MANVLFIVVDSLMPQPLNTLLQQRELPGFSFLISHGYQTTLTSVFPTMSVVNDSSILTGTYPDEHGIPGLVWFKRDEGRIVDYGDALGNIIRQGALIVGRDTVKHLNDTHLSQQVETIHEYLAKRGISSASVNLMVRRGLSKHPLRTPFNRLLGVESVSGPQYLHLGYFLDDGTGNFPTPFNQYGYGYDQVKQMTVNLMTHPNRPRLIISYLSDPDKKIHKEGPDVRRPVYDVDRFIQHILGTFPSWEDTLQTWTIAVMGDSGQSHVLQNEAKALIQLDELLSPYTLLGMGKGQHEADLAVAPNERSAYVYPLHSQMDLLQLAKRILTDERVDLVAMPTDKGAYVLTAKGELFFRKGGNQSDPYGQTWEVIGDPALLDVKGTGNRWEYGKYPDVFSQLYGATHSQPEPFAILAAKPGYEFQFQSSPTHVGGGSHGGISEKEMTVPLIVGGATRKPVYNRLVDMKKFIIDCLGIP